MPLRLLRIRVTRRRVIAGSVVLAVVAALIGWAVWPTSPPFTATDQMITVRSGPTGDEPVVLDTTLFLPDRASAQEPVPAVLLAHGFGGTKQSVVTDAKDFAGRGYAVLTWTARGFGRSGGEIHLDSPDYEVRDAQRLIDWLAARPDIARDGDGDPKVAAVGGSYGGALALMLAGQDNRVDAIVPMITWNDLSRAFLPDGAGQGPEDGVFKKQWAGLFFGSGNGAGGGLLGGLGDPGIGAGGDGGADGPPASPGATSPPDGASPPDRTSPPDAASPTEGASPGGTAASDKVPASGGAGLDALARVNPACGRFAADVCAAYLDVATDGAARNGTSENL